MNLRERVFDELLRQEYRRESKNGYGNDPRDIASERLVNLTVAELLDMFDYMEWDIVEGRN